MKKYKCEVCGYVYDPEVGDPDNGIEPGTPFEELPKIGFARFARKVKRCLKRFKQDVYNSSFGAYSYREYAPYCSF